MKQSASHPFDDAMQLSADAPGQYRGEAPAPYWNMVGPFGGITAATLLRAVLMGHRKMVDALDAEEVRLRALGQQPGVSGPSPGVNKMEFKAPVRPGDTVTYTLTVTGKRPSNSIPGWGLLFNSLDAVNQRGEQVYHAELVGFSKLRDYQTPLHLRVLEALTKIPGLGKLLTQRS